MDEVFGKRRVVGPEPCPAAGINPCGCGTAACHYLLVDYLDRLGVQLAEARRLAKHGSVPRSRLALLLLDNTAETILRSSADVYLTWADFHSKLLRQVEHAAPDDAKGQELIQQLRPLVVSRTQQRNIDRNFNLLVDYVFEQDDWSLGTEFADCVKILHRFRNDAYHRDRVRADVLEPAVTIYFYLVAHLLKHRKSIFSVIDSAPAGALELLEDDVPDADYLGLPAHHSGNLEAAMSERILRDFVPDHAKIADSLSRHFVSRLDGIERDLKDIGEFFAPPSIARSFAIRLTQCTDDEWCSQEPPEDFWTRSMAVNDSVLATWRTQAHSLARITDALEALRVFARQETSMAQFEGRASELAIEVDKAIQQETDFRRGK